MKRHIIGVHGSPKPFKCEICDKIFQRKYELRRHITIVHDENFSNIIWCGGKKTSQKKASQKKISQKKATVNKKVSHESYLKRP